MSGDMNRLMQSWWKIEDVLSPSNAKIYRRVIDLHTDEAIQYISLMDRFLGLKVLNKLDNNYLVFLDVTEEVPKKYVENNEIIMAVNLGDLSKYPSAGKVSGTKLYHVRIEIEYVDPCPFFEKRWDLDIQSRFLKFWNSFIFKRDTNYSCNDKQISEFHLSNFVKRPGYETSFISSGPSQPEFTLIAPRGMRIVNDYKSTKLMVVNDNERIKLGKANVMRLDGKESYNLLSNKKSYDKNRLALETESLELKLSYIVVNKHKFYLIPLLSWILIYIGYEGFNICHSQVTSTQSPLLSFIFTYIILQISFLTLYLTLRRENYEIPFNSTIIPSILISILVFIACFNPFIVKWPYQIYSLLLLIL
jgi:hypothetical protein